MLGMLWFAVLASAAVLALDSLHSEHAWLALLAWLALASCPHLPETKLDRLWFSNGFLLFCDCFVGCAVACLAMLAVLAVCVWHAVACCACFC